MSQLPKIVRGRLAGAPIAQSHPDPDLLTAFVEGGLGARERDLLISHLAACAECRDVVALATPESLATPDLQFAAARSTPKWWDMSALRWATVSATAVIVLAAALLVRPVHKTEAPYLTGSNLATDERAATSLKKSDEHGTTHATLVAPAALPPNRKAEPAARALDLESAYSSRDKLEAKQSPKPRMISPNTSAEIVQEAPAVPALRSDVVTKAKSAAAPAAENIAQSGPAVSGQVASGLAGGVAGGTVAAAPQTDSTRAAAAPSRISPLASNIARSNEENQLQSQVAETSASKGPAYAAPNKNAMAKKATAARQSAEEDGATGGVSAGQAAKISTATVASAGARPPAEVMSTPTSIAKDKLPPLRWTIDRGGNLQRSADGKTWDVVPVPNGTKLHSLAVLENELWAGGSGGALYHSSDGGTQWVRVHPAAGEAELSGDITRITLADPQHITLTTSSSEQWTSADGGRTWQRR